MMAPYVTSQNNYSSRHEVATYSKSYIYTDIITRECIGAQLDWKIKPHNKISDADLHMENSNLQFSFTKYFGLCSIFVYWFSHFQASTRDTWLEALGVLDIYNTSTNKPFWGQCKPREYWTHMRPADEDNCRAFKLFYDLLVLYIFMKMVLEDSLFFGGH